MLSRNPVTLKPTWESIEQIHDAGRSGCADQRDDLCGRQRDHQCGYGIASHTAAARKKGMSEAMFAELMAAVGMANETNRLAAGYQVEIDEQFK